MFWHEYAKIPRHTSQNAITEGDFKCILTRNCKGTEQLQNIYVNIVDSKKLVNQYKKWYSNRIELWNIDIKSY